MLTDLLKRVKLQSQYRVWAPLKANFYPSYYTSHSQFGEDMILRHLTGGRLSGFYLDIGAHHPMFLSNTYHFYLKGWRGINVDALPGSMDLFRQLRPRDINLEICLGTEDGKEVDFFLFDSPAYNTCDPQLAEQVDSTGRARLVRVCRLKTTTLASLLATHLPVGQQVDLLNIDIEGLDEVLLMSNDWGRFRPNLIVFEKYGLSLDTVTQEPMVRFLNQFGYQCITRCGPSLILMQEEAKKLYATVLL